MNKFGISLDKRRDYVTIGRLRLAIESLRNYVRDNALCQDPSTDYVAKERKIRRLAVPEVDTDATNKRYVELALNSVREEEARYRENIENITSRLRKDTDELQKGFFMLYSNIEKADNARDKLLQDLRKTMKELEEKTTTKQLFEKTMSRCDEISTD
ncbi:unnamed protein product [Lasius platythorax]|uniref:Uncharacterized protein n=1 Tax=Lasius platythorax TaxID=488582 RepID=A0AAV2NRQ1_9HYME